MIQQGIGKEQTLLNHGVEVSRSYETLPDPVSEMLPDPNGGDYIDRTDMKFVRYN